MNNIYDNKLRKYQISILGESYFLVSDESEKHLISAAELVDGYVKEIIKKYPDTNLNKIGILVALQFASRSLKAKETIEHFQEYSDKLLSFIDMETAQLNIEKF